MSELCCLCGGVKDCENEDGDQKIVGREEETDVDGKS